MTRVTPCTGEPCGLYRPGVMFDPRVDCRRCWQASRGVKDEFTVADTKPAPAPVIRPVGPRTVYTNRPDPNVLRTFGKTTGPGTELKGLLEILGVTPQTGCGCGDMAAKMDRWGVAGCREHKAEIIDYLEEQRKKAGWWASGMASIHALMTGLAWKLNVLGPLGSLVDEAIRRAEESELLVIGPEGPNLRHLLYYVYPVKGNGVWQLNLDRLLSRIELFNGRRVVCIATDSHTDDAGAVADYLGDEAETFRIKNDPNLRETAAWDELWGRLEDEPLPSATFFAHAKGVTKPVNPGVTVHEWAAVMYEANLDYWPVVAASLARHPIAGTFKKYGKGFPGASEWHYSGTFYWVRNADFFARDWRGKIDRTWWGTESYPGVAFDQSEGGIVFGRGAVPILNLYVWDTWKRIRPSLEAWRTANSGYRTQFPSATGSVSDSIPMTL